MFGGGFDGALDGLVELAWTDPATGSLRNAQMFGTDQLEELVERAAELNRTERCNVYVGAALRKPGTALAKRTADSDFHSAPFAWADIDDDCVEAAIKAAKAAGVPATMTVVTGRHPHMRAQFWWRLVDAERDGAEIKALCSGIGLALGGDSTVSNPGRVLQLGGSIAGPLKPGRVVESTEVHIPEDDRPPAYWASALAQAFAAPAPLLQTVPAASEPSAPSIAPSTPKPLDLPIGSLSIEATLAAIQRNDHWHQNAVRLVGNWVARGLSDAEILSFAPALTIGNGPDGRSYTVDQTCLQLNSMITGARRKWNLPNPVVTIDDKLPPPPIEIEWEDGASAAMIPRRRWLVGSFAIRGHLTVLVAPPGAGKSTLGIALAVAGVTGRGEIVGETVHETIKAWVWNNEDDRNELRRRLAAIMQQWNVAPADLRGKLGLNSGSERPLVIAKATKDGAVVRLPDIEAIIERVRLEGIGLRLSIPSSKPTRSTKTTTPRSKPSPPCGAKWPGAAIARSSLSTTPASRRRLRPMPGRARCRPRAARRRSAVSRGSCARSSPCRRATPTSSASMRMSAACGCVSMMRRQTCRSRPVRPAGSSASRSSSPMARKSARWCPVIRMGACRKWIAPPKSKARCSRRCARRHCPDQGDTD